MKKRHLLSALLAAALVFISGAAFAGGPPAVGPPGGIGACGGGTIGAVICNVIENSLLTQSLFPALCYLFGIFIGVWAVAKLYSHINNPNQTTVWEPIQRAVVAGALFALPMVMEAVYITLTNGDDTGLNVGGWSGTPTGGGLDAMVVALMNDSYDWVGQLLMFFCYLAGLVLTVIGIMRLMKSAQEGPRGPGGFGTIMTFLIAGALFSADEMMAAWSNSLFLTNDVAVTATLNFNAGLKAAEEQHILAVISAVLAFVMILGWISFIRGLFIIRDVAEGNSQASLMSGMTHLFGGALAINLGPVLNAVQETFGLLAIGVNFS